MDPKEIGLWEVEWIDQAQDTERRRAAVSTVMRHRVPSNWGAC
jgi:hypothetical protein